MLVKGLKIIGGIDGGLACRFTVDFFPAPKPDGCQAQTQKSPNSRNHSGFMINKLGLFA